MHSHKFVIRFDKATPVEETIDADICRINEVWVELVDVDSNGVETITYRIKADTVSRIQQLDHTDAAGTTRQGASSPT